MEQAPAYDPSPAPPPVYRLTGAVIRRLRLALGMLQHELGVALGYRNSSANTTISKMESGRILPTSVALARLAQLCQASGVEPDAARDLLRAIAADGSAVHPLTE